MDDETHEKAFVSTAESQNSHLTCMNQDRGVSLFTVNDSTALRLKITIQKYCCDSLMQT